ncbi:MAG: HAMP domain-containing histidine kinase [Chthoniobacter sp.]|nr:HAMP domain-containing histidine kinase [Chthoniobacter sp.]
MDTVFPAVNVLPQPRRVTLHEFKPKQLRALLLLLVLVPFIPMVLMLRFMLDALSGEREAALERAASVYQQTVVNAGPSLAKHLASKGGAAHPEDARKFFRALFDGEIEIAIADGGGQIVAGVVPVPGKLVARAPLRHLDLPWQVQLYLVDDKAIRDGVRSQFKIYAWIALGTAVAICVIAGTAGLTVSRQLRLHELQNTSVATVAHELRTPLASMRMLVDTLREGRCRTEEQRREYLDLIAAENLRLSRLTDNFLTHARLHRGQHGFTFERVVVRPVIDAAVAALRGKLDAPGCAFTLDVVEPLPDLIADHDALVTVLTNLLENALKYTGDDKRLSLRVRSTAEHVVFTVADNGVGLTRAERKQIFAPFFQADQKLSRAREGCGLGLAIVQEIVVAHRGTIVVESEPGAGSSFIVSLPTQAA